MHIISYILAYWKNTSCFISTYKELSCTVKSPLQAATLIEAYLFQIEAAVIQGD